MDFHLATEQPSSRGAHGWAHAVSDAPDVRLTMCGLPVGALVEWPDAPIPDTPQDQAAYCQACTARVTHQRIH